VALLLGLLLGPPGRLPSLFILPSDSRTWLRHCRSLRRRDSSSPIKRDLIASASAPLGWRSLPLW
jgi:hypothetical protein